MLVFSAPSLGLGIGLFADDGVCLVPGWFFQAAPCLFVVELVTRFSLRLVLGCAIDSSQAVDFLL